MNSACRFGKVALVRFAAHSTSNRHPPEPGELALAQGLSTPAPRVGLERKMTPRMLVSFVLPCYNEAKGIHMMMDRLEALAAARPHLDFEFVFVNDGSRDDTAVKLDAFAARDERVKVVHLARNMGHQIALTAGLDFARGDAVCILDADLQHPPELVDDMLAKVAEGYDIVHAQRTNREGESAFKALTAKAYYKLLSAISHDEVAPQCGDFRMITKRVVEVVRRFREPHRYMRGLFFSLGFRQCLVSYDCGERCAGETKYTLRKMLNLASAGIISCSSAPVTFLLTCAAALWGASLLYLAYALVQHAMGETIPGWTSLVVLLTFFTGLVLFSLWIIALYVSKIYEQGRMRPLYWLAGTRNVRPEDVRGRAGEGEGREIRRDAC